MASPAFKACMLVAALALTPFASALGHEHHPVHGAEAVKSTYVATLANLGISQPWSRALPPTSVTGAVFVSVFNQGETDHLLAAQSPVAQALELHNHLEQDGLMQMIEVQEIEIPGAGGLLELKPGSYHIMLIGLKQPLREGDRFPLQLSFARSGTIELEVEVRSMDAGTGAEHLHHH